MARNLILRRISLVLRWNSSPTFLRLPTSVSPFPPLKLTLSVKASQFLLHAHHPKRPPLAQFPHSTLYFWLTPGRSLPPSSAVVLALPSAEIISSLSLNLTSRRLVLTHPSTLAIVSAVEPHPPPPLPAILTTKFNCLGAGAAMRTNYILKSPLRVSSIFHPACIWPLLMLQFPHLWHFLSRPVWLELGLPPRVIPMGRSLARELGRRKIHFIFPPNLWSPVPLHACAPLPVSLSFLFSFLFLCFTISEAGIDVLQNYFIKLLRYLLERQI